MADHWKSIANILGAPGMAEPDEDQVADDPQANAEEGTPESESQPTESDSAAVESDDQGPQAEGDIASEPEQSSPPEVIQAVAPKAASPKTPKKERPPAIQKKRSSSWETLASMFNIKVERPKEEEAVEEEAVEKQEEESATLSQPSGTTDDAEVRSDDAVESTGSSKRAELAIFNEDEEDSNSALDAMFADAPRSDADDWNENRRVVDDIGWGDETSDSQPTEPVSDRAEVDRETRSRGERDSFEGDEAEEPARRGRRRRRGGRGRERRDEPQETDATKRDTEADAWGDETNQSSSTAWDEPAGLQEEDVESGEVERRSNRRRRRGRARSDEKDSGPEMKDDREDRGFDDAPSEEIAEKPPSARGRGERDSRDRDRDRDSRGRARDTERGEGRRRRRPEESLSDAPRRRTKQSDGGADEGPDDRADERETEPQHRNIPTWVEALEPIVENNVDNHRRNENRGGSRGRSRGRR